MSKRFSKPPSRPDRDSTSNSANRPERGPTRTDARPASRQDDRRTDAPAKPRGPSNRTEAKPFAPKSPKSSESRPAYAKPAFAKPARAGGVYGKPRDPAPPAERPAPPQQPAREARPPRDAKPSDRRPREGHGRTAEGTWLWGWHAVLAALKNPERKPVRLVATSDAADEIEEKLGETTLPLQPSIMSKDELDRLLPASAVHQGLALLTKPLPAVLIDDIVAATEHSPRAVVLILDQVTDPHNIGAVLRSAAAFGAAAVILPDRNAPEISGTLAKSASGAVDYVPLVRVVNLTRTMEQLKAAGYWCIGLAGESESLLGSHKLDGKVCLVLGSEGDGMRRLTREACDLMARLPTQGPVASLNVSNAAAIALYECVRATSA